VNFYPSLAGSLILSQISELPKHYLCNSPSLFVRLIYLLCMAQRPNIPFLSCASGGEGSMRRPRPAPGSIIPWLALPIILALALLTAPPKQQAHTTTGPLFADASQ
jgi:hypothetical protein